MEIVMQKQVKIDFFVTCFFAHFVTKTHKISYFLAEKHVTKKSIFTCFLGTKPYFSSFFLQILQDFIFLRVKVKGFTFNNFLYILKYLYKHFTKTLTFFIQFYKK